MPATTHFAPHGKLGGSRLGSTPVISVAAVAAIPALVRHTFGDKVLRRANQAAMLDIEAIEDRDCFIPHATMTTFADAIAKRAGEEELGLMLAPHLTIASYGCWGDYILGTPTLGAAVERAVATMGFHGKGDTFAFRETNGVARLSYVSAAKGLEGYRHVACGIVGVILSLCRFFLPSDWRPRSVELDIPTPQRAWVFESEFGCPVLFDAPEVVVCLEADHLLARSSRRSAPPLVTIADLARARIDWRRTTDLRDVVTQQIWTQVLSGTVSIESAARSLNTSVRTLQRELNSEGTDFRTLANTMRTRRALELLTQTDASVTRISAVLGYSAPAHFARAFRKATGFSPQEFRRR